MSRGAGHIENFPEPIHFGIHGGIKIVTPDCRSFLAGAASHFRWLRRMGIASGT
jgi:hypothetical protein